MKKFSLIIFTSLAVVIMIITFSADQVMSYASGGPEAHSGSPADGKTCRNCHTGPLETAIDGLIISDIPSEGYLPGETYNLTASIGRNGHSKFGFQISPQNNQGTLLGSLISTSNETKLVGTGKYLTQTSSGTNGNNEKSWTFQWTAPTEGTGSVTFYAAFNVTNNNNSKSGDTIFTSTLVIPEGSVSSIEETTALRNEFVIFPTFTNNFIKISVNSAANQQCTLEVISITGNAIKENSFALNSGKNSFTQDVSDLAPGLYFIKMKVDGKEQIQKVIVGK
jgi:hypothetical protein